MKIHIHVSTHISYTLPKSVLDRSRTKVTLYDGQTSIAYVFHMPLINLHERTYTCVCPYCLHTTQDWFR